MQNCPKNITQIKEIEIKESVHDMSHEQHENNPKESVHDMSNMKTIPHNKISIGVKQKKKAAATV